VQEPVSNVIRFLNKNHPICGKNSQNSCRAKKRPKIYIKVKFERPKHLHQTTFECAY